VRGVQPATGRVLQAVELTLSDVEDQAATQAALAFNTGGSGDIRGGGLRSGRFRLGDSSLLLNGVVFVPGVRVTARLLNKPGRIGLARVSGSRTVAGTIVYGPRGIVTGTIGGRRFRVRLRGLDTTPPTITLGKQAAGDRPRPKVG
jgi:hypothetical protein